MKSRSKPPGQNKLESEFEPIAREYLLAATRLNSATNSDREA